MVDFSVPSYGRAVAKIVCVLLLWGGDMTL